MERPEHTLTSDPGTCLCTSLTASAAPCARTFGSSDCGGKEKTSETPDVAGEAAAGRAAPPDDAPGPEEPVGRAAHAGAAAKTGLAATGSAGKSDADPMLTSCAGSAGPAPVSGSESDIVTGESVEGQDTTQRRPEGGARSRNSASQLAPYTSAT